MLSKFSSLSENPGQATASSNRILSIHRSFEKKTFQDSVLYKIICILLFSMCHPNPCYPGVSCTAKAWYFQCGSCPPAMTGDGISCFPSKMADKVNCEQDGDGANCSSNTIEQNLTREASREEKMPSALKTTAATPAATTTTASVTSTTTASVTPTTTASTVFQTTITQETAVEEKSSIFPTTSPPPLPATAEELEEPRQPCHSNPCHVNVSCVSIAETSFTCGPCPPGYQVRWK